MKAKQLQKMATPHRFFQRKPVPFYTVAGRSEPGRDALLERTVRDPGQLAIMLTTTDGATRARVIRRLQQEHGNIYVQRVIAAFTSVNNSSPVIQRQQCKKPKANSLATTTIGPPRTSTYSIKGKSLAEVATAYASRDEAGSVEWRPHLSYKDSGTTGKITSATVTVPMNVTLPIWNPPASTGPKTKAEWNRARNALKAHEDGHIELVHKHFGGLADKLIGKTPAEAQALFEETTANLQKESDEYDAKADHGRNTGTVIDTRIEEKEQQEAAKKHIHKKKNIQKK